jgi:hypothetical protein
VAAAQAQYDQDVTNLAIAMEAEDIDAVKYYEKAIEEDKQRLAQALTNLACKTGQAGVTGLPIELLPH